MNILRIMLAELKNPDAMGDSWYDWASNQLSHVIIGLIITGLIVVSGGGNLWGFTMAFVFAFSKEIFDLKNGANVKDALYDAFFQMFGAMLAISLANQNASFFYFIVTTVILALLSGAFSRLKKEGHNE
jgi:uncharacterized membrane protein